MGKPDFLSLDRIRSRVKQHAAQRSSPEPTGGDGILPTYHRSPTSKSTNKAGGLATDTNAGSTPVDGPADSHSGLPTYNEKSGDNGGLRGSGGGHAEEIAVQERSVADDRSPDTPPAAPPPLKSEDASSGDSALGQTGGQPAKAPLSKRFVAEFKQIYRDLYHGVCHSWINVLLIFVPVGIVVEALSLNPGVVFGLNAVAIIPLAGLLSFATEAVAARLGDTLGALLNVSFGNAVELIIFIIALVKGEIEIVQASLLGSILANLLLILGMAFLLGGLRYREQLYNSTVTQMSACLLSLSVMSLLLPTAFHASFSDSASQSAETNTLAVSRGTSVVLLIVYVLYLLFQLKSHAYMYESTPQAVIDEESHPGVLADMMGSSSSSSDSSTTSDSSDTDTSGSGSIMKKTKKFRRKFKHRRRRTSSASAESVVTGSASVPSVLSSPSTERQGSYWEHQLSNNKSSSRRELKLGNIASGDEADADDENGNVTRIRDFVLPTTERTKSPEIKKTRKKHHKKSHKKRRSSKNKDEVAEPDTEKKTVENSANINDSTPHVGFAENIETVEAQGADALQSRRSLNMRQLSSRNAFARPILPKMLSNNVFNTPPPVAATSPRAGPVRSHSSGQGPSLRRTNSLPDRLNRAVTPSGVPAVTTVAGPLPPYGHLRHATSDDLGLPEDDDGKPQMTRTSAVVMLLASTALVAVCAEFMVDAIPKMIENSPVSEAFIGLIILPIVGNAAEHVTAVTVATKNKMDLAIGVAVGSSIQIALFVTPIIVLLGWILNTNMSLYFNLFETISLFVTAFVVNFLVLDGRSNYLEGSLLIAAYVIIAVGAFYYPSVENQSAVGGGDSRGEMAKRMVGMMF